jgi:hypothetical protein
LVYGPEGLVSQDPQTGALDTRPGGASGAKASPVNGLPTVYGQSKGTRTPGDPGTVVVKLLSP